MPDTPEPHVVTTLLSFDYGRRRIGVAVGQRITGSASPVGVAKNGDAGPDWVSLERWIMEWRPERLVVGMPYHADGSASEIGAEALEFSRQLGRFGLPVEQVDERHTSQEAAAILREQRAMGRRRARKGDIDTTAAVLIAERWLCETTLDTRS